MAGNCVGLLFVLGVECMVFFRISERFYTTVGDQSSCLFNFRSIRRIFGNIDPREAEKNQTLIKDRERLVWDWL